MTNDVARTILLQLGGNRFLTHDQILRVLVGWGYSSECLPQLKGASFVAVIPERMRDTGHELAKITRTSGHRMFTLEFITSAD